MRQTIEVNAAQTTLEAVRTQAADTVSIRNIESLPLNGRNYMDLALLVPGVSRTNTGAPTQFAETSAVPAPGFRSPASATSTTTSWSTASPPMTTRRAWEGPSIARTSSASSR